MRQLPPQWPSIDCGTGHGKAGDGAKPSDISTQRRWNGNWMMYMGGRMRKIPRLVDEVVDASMVIHRLRNWSQKGRRWCQTNQYINTAAAADRAALGGRCLPRLVDEVVTALMIVHRLQYWEQKGRRWFQTNRLSDTAATER